MKTTEKKDLQTKTKVELVKLLKDAQAALMQLKLAHQQNKLENTRSIFSTRKQIAVLKTILNMKNAVEAQETPAEKAEVKETKKKEVKKGE